jgi:hypothetical protein
MADRKDKNQLVLDTRAKVDEARDEIDRTKYTIATTGREVREVTDHILGSQDAIVRSLENLKPQRERGRAGKKGPPKG